MLRIVAFFEAVMGVIYEKSHQVRGRYRPQKSKLQVPTCSKVQIPVQYNQSELLPCELQLLGGWDRGRVEAMAWAALWREFVSHELTIIDLGMTPGITVLLLYRRNTVMPVPGVIPKSMVTFHEIFLISTYI